MARILKLENRAVIRLAGTDGRELLQGLITNDINILAENMPVYAGLLTPQGKFMFDMIIVADGEDILLDVEAERKADLSRRLMMYKLRADVDIIDETLSVWALFDGLTETGIAYNDPRSTALQTRVIAAENPAPSAEQLPLDEYENLRIRLCVPDGSRDIAIEKYFWLETGAETLNGVSFTKGCYVGQELTARMKHRTSVKKQLRTVEATEGMLMEGDTIMNDAGRAIGEIKTTAAAHAIAYLRLDLVSPLMKTENAALSLYNSD
ncbi:CAF17-like 4Fe-4S cluster assembly/insertion protein YgfZ [Kordiimonas aquimaris]|uniref:CAF17-like 4Fe-4S cluster assembly/insertion protein YgfZ n=1 Tax=Kordiimonas aquimaris TaxID=707591 RepID=UPI0021D16C8F|nr:hypothetical protein [Kordiimonas aquimaris]